MKRHVTHARETTPEKAWTYGLDFRISERKRDAAVGWIAKFKGVTSVSMHRDGMGWDMTTDAAFSRRAFWREVYTKLEEMG